MTCWGSNNSGQTDVPDGLLNPSALAAGGAVVTNPYFRYFGHICALGDNGVSCSAVCRFLPILILPPSSIIPDGLVPGSQVMSATATKWLCSPKRPMV